VAVTTNTTVMSEAQLFDCVIQTSHLFGWKVAHFRAARTANGWRTPVSADGAGFPDCVLVRERIVVAELKSQRGRTSDAQKDWLAVFSNANIETYVWRPENWTSGEIEQVLRRRSPDQSRITPLEEAHDRIRIPLPAGPPARKNFR
jgi:hypothetical protein